jgi:flotillin
VIAQEAEGRAQAAVILAVAEAEAAAIKLKALALVEAGAAYMDLRRLELAPSLTREVAAALANGQFVNFGSTGNGGQGAVASGSDDVLRVVQTLLAAQVITRGDGIGSSPPARPAVGNGRPTVPPTSKA